MIKIIVGILTLGYSSHKEISEFLFSNKACMPKELKGF